MLELPIKNEICFSERIILDSIPYNFTFVWNILGFWSLTIANRNNEVLISGIKIVLNLDLLDGYPDLNLPEGKLFAIDFSGNNSEIGKEDFINQRQVKLIYIEKGEVL